MPAEFLIGVDIGTYSSKGVLVTTRGEVIASHSVPHEMDMPHPGFFEHDADRIWWGDFVHIVRELLVRTGFDPKQVRAVGASAIGSCVLPIDENGYPLRPGILYGIDTRAFAEIAYLESQLSKDQIFKTSGSHLTSQASGPKILWIRNHEPDVFERTRWFLTSQAYLVYKLTGIPSIDIYTAGGYAPLFDIHRRQWISGAAKHITPIERLPGTYWSSEVVGSVTADAARETGLAEGTPVVCGTTDAAAEAISAGVAEFGDMMLMFGSSIFFIMKTAGLVRTQNFWSATFLEEGAFSFLGGMSTSGSLTTWFRNQLGQLEMEQERLGGENAYAALAKAASESPVGSHGLLFLPYFEGERTPLHDHKAKGMWFGLGLKHTKGDLYRALLEGVAFGIRHNLEVMASEGVYPARILAVGGGTKNPLWMQIVCDVCNIEMLIPEQQVGACFGDAFLAGVGAGYYRNLTEVTHWTRVKERIHPIPANTSRYEVNYSIFKDLYTSTKPLMHQMHDLYST